MPRKHPIEEINLQVTGVSVFSNSDYDGLAIEWSADIGWGQYTFLKEHGTSEWIADSEHMDGPDDRAFGQELLRLWLAECTVQ